MARRLLVLAMTAVVLTAAVFGGRQVWAYLGEALSSAPSSSAGHASRQPVAMSDGLVGWWRFDGDATDGSGNARNGTLTCAGTGCWTPSYRDNAKFGRSMYFSGSGASVHNHVRAASINLASAAGSKLTFSSWVKPDAAQSAATPYFVRNGLGADENYGIRLGSKSGSKWVIFVDYYDGTWRGVSTTNYVVSENEWNLVTVVFSQGEWVDFYVNGQFVERKVWVGSASYLSTTSLNIGGHDGTSNQYFTGSMDDVRVYNRELSVSEIARLYAGSQPIPCDQACVGWWKLDEGSGTSAVNAIPSGGIGTLMNGNTNTPTADGTANGPIWSSGTFGGGMKFDGSNDYISVPHNSAQNSSSTLTLSAWIKLDTLNRYNGIIGKSDTIWGNTAYAFRVINTNQLDILLTIAGNTGGGYAELASDTRLTSGTWYHVAAVFNKPNVTLYINGRADKTSTWNNDIYQSTTDLIIGGYAYGMGLNYLMSGSLDDVRIYNRALTDYEIYDQYAAGR